eukprot:6213539-Pleurochrysis_carterae.AAC.3
MMIFYSSIFTPSVEKSNRSVAQRVLYAEVGADRKFVEVCHRRWLPRVGRSALVCAATAVLALQIAAQERGAYFEALY